MINNPAIILVDMQNDFFTGPHKAQRIQSVIKPLQRLIAVARKNAVPVIYCIDAHYPQDVEVTQKWRGHTIKNTKGAEVISEISPDQKVDYIVEKRAYSGFYETDLDPLLQNLYDGEGAKSVVIGGVQTNIGIRHTAADAFFQGYHIIVAEDGVDALSDENHQQGLMYLEYVYNAKIMTTNNIIKEITSKNSYLAS
ncbi:isochorismatase family cysteine hydrolase [Candidatus Bathycorpusculum sp.]|uniref:cysteine hydrolase family protein n=1 Tax=Candidatus Bathycorpusculum sp. TaxID=2994959 RepID=UPI002837BAC5|nr:cysteine hydrolase [Candidatus Termitimicrobium sp.]MCL2686642.1 cysteine hydrolase [Candidatus Termitimicrobium sp.]